MRNRIMDPFGVAAAQLLDQLGAMLKDRDDFALTVVGRCRSDPHGHFMVGDDKATDVVAALIDLASDVQESGEGLTIGGSGQVHAMEPEVARATARVKP